jgi:hypothetical protein
MQKGNKVIKYSFILLILFAVCPAFCSEYFVATDGNDINSGTIDSPFKTIPKAVSLITAGDIIYLRGGTHNYSATITISSSKSGTSGNLITMQAYQNESPILDFTLQPDGDSYKGIILNGSYWHFKSFTIQKAGHVGLNVTGSHNILERLVTHENGDTGLNLPTGASYNLVLNCDSYLNCDPEENGEDADGFGAKFTTGVGNIFRGCRSWSNSDDGFDLWQAGNAVRFENCWAFRNGVNIWGFSPMNGDGNGFKLGQGTGKHAVIGCLAYRNQYRGIDQNGNSTGADVNNCTSVNNLYRNYVFSTSSSNYVLHNNISYLGTNSIAANVVNTYNSWNTGFSVSAADFASLDANGLDGPRGPNGELPKLKYMRLAPTSALIDAGMDVGLPYYGDAPDLGAFEHIDGDCQPDGDVDFLDLKCVADNWLNMSCGTCNGADFDNNNKVNLFDFAIMAENWLK